MIDVDYFKLYNDNYGHQKGDLVLKTGANVLKRSCRKGDVFARYGGEEFIVIVKENNGNLFNNLYKDSLSECFILLY